eukprot:g23230.t1
MEPAEIDVLKAFLHPEVVMFEFGAGGSTVAFSELVKELYVAEHNPSWAQEVKERCDARGIRNVHLLSALPNRSALEQMGATDCGILRPQLVFDKADPLRKTYGPNLDPKWRDASPAQREAVFKDYLKLIQEANHRCSVSELSSPSSKLGAEPAMHSLVARAAEAISAAKRLLSVVSETTWKDVPSDASEWTRPTRPNGLRCEFLAGLQSTPASKNWWYLQQVVWLYLSTLGLHAGWCWSANWKRDGEHSDLTAWLGGLKTVGFGCFDLLALLALKASRHAYALPRVQELLGQVAAEHSELMAKKCCCWGFLQALVQQGPPVAWGWAPLVLGKWVGTLASLTELAQKLYFNPGNLLESIMDVDLTS